jgi:hypothetical protein
MTKNDIITNSYIINILNQYFTTKVTKESQKLSLNSTKVNIKHTKDFRFLILALNAFSIFDICVIYFKM